MENRISNYQRPMDRNLVIVDVQCIIVSAFSFCPMNAAYIRKASPHRLRRFALRFASSLRVAVLRRPYNINLVHSHQPQNFFLSATKHHFLWLIKNDFPPGYQVLCFNCNYAKTAFGKCPCLSYRQVKIVQGT